MLNARLISICALTFNALAAQPSWRENLEAGRNLAMKGSYQDAEAKLLAAVREAQSTGGNARSEALACNEAATLYQLLGKPSQAKTYFHCALSAWEGAYPEDERGLMRILSNLTLLYLNLGQLGRAEQTCRSALALATRSQKSDPLAMARLYQNLGSIYCAKHKYAKAEAEYRRAQAILEEDKGPEHAEVGAVLNNLGVLYGKAGRRTEAIAHLEKSVAIGRSNSDLGFGMALELDNLGTLYTRADMLPQAARAFEEALQIAERHPDLARRHLPGILSNYAAALRKMNRNEEAKALTSRVQAIRLERSSTIDLRDLTRSKARQSRGQPLAGSDPRAMR